MITPPLILLAGGHSRRMGQRKALLPFRGRTWLEAQLGAFACDGGAEAVVVIADPPLFCARLPWLGSALSRDVRASGLRVRALVQPRPEEGPFSSLRLALAATSGSAFVLPVDVPTAPGVFRQLVRALGDRDAAVPRFAARRGHPVLLSMAFARRLASLPLDAPDARLDRQLANARCAEARVHDEVVLLDLNTQKAWAAWASSAHADRCYPQAP